MSTKDRPKKEKSSESKDKESKTQPKSKKSPKEKDKKKITTSKEEKSQSESNKRQGKQQPQIKKSSNKSKEKKITPSQKGKSRRNSSNKESNKTQVDPKSPSQRSDAVDIIGENKKIGPKQPQKEKEKKSIKTSQKKSKAEKTRPTKEEKTGVKSRSRTKKTKDETKQQKNKDKSETEKETKTKSSVDTALKKDTVEKNIQESRQSPKTEPVLQNDGTPTLINQQETISQPEPQDQTSNRGSDIETDTIDDKKKSIIRKIFRKLITPFAPPLPVSKMLLPREKHLNSKLIIYFSELQILLGVLGILLSVLVFLITNNWILLIIMILVGSSLILTASSSEEIHVTNSRILVRRINFMDRLFRVPRDSQYIIEEIVSFEITRAPINILLFLMGLLLDIPLLFENYQVWYFMLPLISASLLVITISLRLGKRSLGFNMSGGHSILLGVQKGIPSDLVDSFTSIILEKNIITT